MHTCLLPACPGPAWQKPHNSLQANKVGYPLPMHAALILEHIQCKLSNGCVSPVQGPWTRVCMAETTAGSTDFRTLYILTDCCSAFVTYCPSRSINQISNKAKTSIFDTSLNIVLIWEKQGFYSFSINKDAATIYMWDKYNTWYIAKQREVHLN